MFNLVPVRALLDADFASFPTDDSVARYLCLKHRGAHKFDKIFPGQHTRTWLKIPRVCEAEGWGSAEMLDSEGWEAQRSGQ